MLRLRCEQFSRTRRRPTADDEEDEFEPSRAEEQIDGRFLMDGAQIKRGRLSCAAAAGANGPSCFGELLQLLQTKQLRSARLGSSWRSAASGGAAGGIIENRMARICRPRFSPDFQARRALKARDERMKRATNTVSFIARFQRTVIIIIIIIRSSSSSNNNMGIWRGRRLAD